MSYEDKTKFRLLTIFGFFLFATFIFGLIIKKTYIFGPAGILFFLGLIILHVCDRSSSPEDAEKFFTRIFPDD